MDGPEVGNQQLDQNSEFEVVLNWPSLPEPGPHQDAGQANVSLVPDCFARNGDFRPLAWDSSTLQFSWHGMYP